MSDYPPISEYIRQAAHDVAIAESLSSPHDAAVQVLRTVPWLRDPDVAAIVGALDAAGLTICWRP